MLMSGFFSIKLSLLSFYIVWVLVLYSPGMEYMNYLSPTCYREGVCQKKRTYCLSSYWLRKRVIKEGLSIDLVNPGLSVSLGFLCALYSYLCSLPLNSWHKNPAGHAREQCELLLSFTSQTWLVKESNSNIICCPCVLWSFPSPQPSLGNAEQNTNQNKSGTQKVTVLLRQ